MRRRRRRWRKRLARLACYPGHAKWAGPIATHLLLSTDVADGGDGGGTGGGANDRDNTPRQDLTHCTESRARALHVSS